MKLVDLESKEGGKICIQDGTSFTVGFKKNYQRIGYNHSVQSGEKKKQFSGAHVSRTKVEGYCSLEII